MSGRASTPLVLAERIPEFSSLLNKAEKVTDYAPGEMMTRLFPELRTEEPTDAADSLFYVTRDLLLQHQKSAFHPIFVVVGILVFVSSFVIGYDNLRSGNPGQFALW